MIADAAAWHDVENGSYAADLFAWRRLADDCGGAVLDIGAGTGRVALDLAERGHDVTALDCDERLTAALASSAAGRGLAVATAVADARSFDLGRRFALAIAPMQVVQLLGGARGRLAMLACAAAHLLDGGRLAIALADPFEAIPPGEALPPLPDVLEIDGWVLSSTPVAVRPEGGGIAIDRVRQAVSPTGELSDAHVSLTLDTCPPATLVAEAEMAGLTAAGEVVVAPTPDHVGSTIVILGRP